MFQKIKYLINMANNVELTKLITARSAELKKVLNGLKKEFDQLYTKSNIPTTYKSESELEAENRELEKEIIEKTRVLSKLIAENCSMQNDGKVKNENEGIVKKTTENTVTEISRKTKTQNKEGNLETSDNQSVHIGRLDLRIGKIISVEKHPDADSLYVEKVDIGDGNMKTVLSGLVKHVPIEEMQNRVAVFLCNLKPVKMRGILSEGMLMCASSSEHVEILLPPANSVPGDIVTVNGYERNPDPILNPKKKIFETVAPDLKTNHDKIATYKGVPWTIQGKGFITVPSMANTNIK